MNSQFPDIVCTDGVLNGSPRVNGRRLAVGDVVSFVKNYGTLQQVISDYELTIAQIKQALLYCSALACKHDNPNVFCHNCSLRLPQEGPLDISEYEEMIVNGMTIVKGNDGSVFLGTMEELLEEWNGQNWWTIATDLLIDLRDNFKE